MKKILGILTVALTLCMVFTMVSCGDKPGGSNDITIKFELGTAGTTPVTGTAPADVKLKKGESLAANYPADPTFSGYTFTGWFQPSGTTAITASTVFTESVTLTARWTVAPPPPPGGDIGYSVEQDGGASNTATTTGIKFTFDVSVDTLGLTAADITVTVDSTVAGAGSASKGSATLTGTGTTRTLAPITVEHAGLVQVAITKAGIVATTKDVTVHKQGEVTPEYWSITWHANGGTHATTGYPTLILKGTTLAKPTDPTRAGGPPPYVFEGWYTDSHFATAYDFTAAVNANLNLYAKWSGGPPVVSGLTIRFEPYTGYTGPAITINIEEDVTIANWLALDVTPPNALPAGPARPGYYFARWEYNGTAVNATSTVSFSTEDDPVVGVYWSTALTATPAENAEKVRLSNGAFVMYAFDLAEAGVTGTGPNGDITVDDLADITEISLKQKIDEVAYSRMSVRGMRVYGPYAWNDDDIVINQGTWSNGDVLHGDFKITNDKMYIAKMNGDDGNYDTAAVLRFNKFHPYMAYNNAERFGYNNATNPWTNVAGITEITQDAISPDTWFDVTYPMNGTVPGDNAGGQNLALTLARIKEAGTDVLPASTNYNKVYFAIGPSTENPDDMITYLMKDVSLKIGSIDVPGEIPELDGLTSSWDQTFACYEDDNRFTNWRGAPEQDPVTRTAGTYEDDKTGIPLDQAADAEGRGFFYLRLGNAMTGTKNSGITNTSATVTSFDGQFTKGPLVVDFSNTNNEMFWIQLTPAQTKLLGDPASYPEITVELDGTATAPTATYRFLLGAISAGTWNITNMHDGKTFDDLFITGLDVDGEGDPTGTTTVSATARRDELSSFILQLRSNGAAQITINSIKVSYRIAPPTPCNCMTAESEGACIPFVGTITCNKGTPGVICNCAYTAYGDPFNPNASPRPKEGIKQSGNPRYTLLKENGGLLITHRTSDSACIDLDVTGENPGITLTAATLYTVTITGKAYVTANASTAQLGRTGSPWDPAELSTIPHVPITGTTGDIESFTITGTATGAELAGGWARIRVYISASESPDFIINTVKVQAGTDTPVIDITF